jgi:hypothetical protein
MRKPNFFLFFASLASALAGTVYIFKDTPLLTFGCSKCAIESIFFVFFWDQRGKLYIALAFYCLAIYLIYKSFKAK